MSEQRVIHVGKIDPKNVISIPKGDCPGFETFEFTVTPDDLIYAQGLEGLNEILDEQMTAAGLTHTATDIFYEFKTLVEGTTYDALITVVATYTPDDLYGDDEEGSFE